MPDTLNFAITYPCVGVAIDCDSFAEFATDVEAAFVAADATASSVTGAPFGRGSILTAVPQGVKTTLTFGGGGASSVTVRGMTAGVSAYTVITAGLYYVSLVLQNVNQNPTTTSRQVTIQRNGVDQYLHKQSSTTDFFPNIQVSGLINAAVSDTFTATDLWTSSGAILNSEFGSFSAVLVATP